ncbi:Ubiquitin carboxyl-terminal hydrolase domain-containing protein [Phytophthora infestans]|nr:Ubiquitin carboxyl-terminal hydrolase domain-containing protein [Phytophthora infestans]
MTMKEEDARPGEKRGRLVCSGAVCIHVTKENMTAWNDIRDERVAEKAADVAQLQHYALDPEARADPSSELYRCLSCKFRGVREPSKLQMQEIEDGEDDGSFMAHAILHSHNIAMMERKKQLYCASCRDFIYPDAAVGDRRRRKRQIRGAVSYHKLLQRGLVNMGNTCFMSAVLQALAHNPMLQHYFFVAKSHDTTICQQQRQRLLSKRQEQLKTEKETESSNDEEQHTKRGPDPAITVCLGCELASFMALLVPPSAHLRQKTLMASPIAPQGILEAMWNAFPSFIGTAQHDAHELLIALLGGLHSHTHPRVFLHGGASPRYTPRGHSLCDCAVHQHFSGVLRSELACGNCDNASHKFDPFLDVSLSLNDEKNKSSKGGKDSTELTLESLVRQFAVEEELRGSNQVYCVRCSNYQTHYKSLNLHTLPNVLVFHIRRLDFYRQQKLKQTVQFPLTGLNMRPFTSVGIDEASDRKKRDSKNGRPEDPSEYVYDLMAVVNHHGESVNGGHYTSYVRDEVQRWILFDDVEVRTVSAEEVTTSQAYLLYYVRRNPFIAAVG